MARLTKTQIAERDEARAKLRALLAPKLGKKKTVYCLLRHCSRSGMYRSISLKIAVPEIELIYPVGPDGSRDYDAKPRRKRTGEYLRDITYLAARALGEEVDRHEGIGMGGCGMDMGFALVYELGCALWPHGTRKPHGTRNGEPDNDGGYALKHSWL